MHDSNLVASIAVDVMGSDSGPEEVVKGIKRALEEDRQPLEIIAVGDEDIVVKLLKKHGIYKNKRVSNLHAGETINMGEKPMQALKAKKDASMIRAIELVKLGKADAVVSCGNTGVLMTAGTVKLRTMCGIERPALGSIMPGKNRQFVMIDVGANPDPKPQNLLDNAILGANYARSVIGVRNPKVGLLCNGTEEGKGNSLVQAAHKLLKDAGDVINYGGLIEGFDVFDGDCDVIVCDGFTGNLLLKTLEGVIKMFKGLLKEELTRGWLRKLGLLLLAGAFRAIKKRVPIEKYCGAPLLGLNGLVVKAHGSSNAKQIEGAISIALRCVRNRMNESITQDVARVHPYLKEAKARAIDVDDSE